MTGISFDWTISVGNIGTAVLVIGGWFYAFFQLKGDVRVIKHDMKTLDAKQTIYNESVTQLTSILTRVAVQDERFNSLEHRVEVSEADIRDIQHGKGFVSEAIAGEYTRHGKISK